MNKPSALRCTAIGECMIELRAAAPGLLASGYAGDTYNTLYYLNALLRGTASRCRYFTALGDDDFSIAMLAEWQTSGIDTSLVSTRPGKLPGIYRVSTDASGERRFDYWRGDSAARAMMEDIDADQLCAALGNEHLIYLTGISLAILAPAARGTLLEILMRCSQAGVPIAFDDNYRPALWGSRAEARDTMRRALALAAIALVSFPDQQALFGDPQPIATMNRLRALGIREIVVRNGPQPGLLALDHTISGYQPETHAGAIDTTGAGDSFNAAYLAARLTGSSPAAAAQAGDRLAARVVQVRGAIMAPAQIPALEDLTGADRPGPASV